MRTYVVIKTICTDLGFSKVKILGSFIEEKDAIMCRLNYINENPKTVMENYNLHVLPTDVIFPTRENVEIPESVKLGYDVA